MCDTDDVLVPENDRKRFLDLFDTLGVHYTLIDQEIVNVGCDDIIMSSIQVLDVSFHFTDSNRYVGYDKKIGKFVSRIP